MTKENEAEIPIVGKRVQLQAENTPTPVACDIAAVQSQVQATASPNQNLAGRHPNVTAILCGTGAVNIEAVGPGVQPSG